MNTKIIPPNFPNVEMFNVGHSEEELAVLKETAKWFNTRVTKNTEHLLIADKEQFVGIVEYRNFLLQLWTKLQNCSNQTPR